MYLKGKKKKSLDNKNFPIHDKSVINESTEYQNCIK